MSLVIRTARPEDARALSEFAAAVFRDTFAAQNEPADVAAYLAEAFGEARQAQEILDPAGTILLAEVTDVSPAPLLAGYAHLGAGVAPEGVTGPAPIELKRLYVGHHWHGQGVAPALMAAVIDAARARGARTLWLGVWERNPRAIAFYAKHGFTRVGQQIFVLGADRQTDWVLARPLDT